MRNDPTLCIVSLFCNLLLGCFLIVTASTLIAERSSDIVRLTVSSDQLLSTVEEAQVITGKYARAFPIDGEEDDPSTRWRIVIDKNSRLLS